MKRTILALAVLTAALSAPSAAPLGVGIIVGEPDAGLCLKAPRAGLGSAVFAAAWHFDNHLYLHGDYIIENTGLMDEYDLIIYYGLGVRLLFRSDPLVGVRVPIGLNYRIQGTPLDCFLEVVPLLNLVPSTDFYPHAACGLRFFFK